MEADVTVQDLNTVAEFLALRDVNSLSEIQGQLDLAILLGNSLVPSVEVAAEVMKMGKAKRLLISGGIGHSTQHLRNSMVADPRFRSIRCEGRAEAAILADALAEHGISGRQVLLESRSTNCGSNAVEARRLLEKNRLLPKSALLIQDPTMQRRTDASFRRTWKDLPQTRFVNFAPFVPQVTQHEGHLIVEPDTPGIWPFKRFLSLLLGEVPRLRDAPGGYGPQGAGFIEHVDIPRSVHDAYQRLTWRFPDFVRP